MIRKLMPSCRDGILCSAKNYWATAFAWMSNFLVQALFDL